MPPFSIPTEPIGSIPRPLPLLKAIVARDPRILTPEEVCARVLEAAEYIPVEQLGATDDCGFSLFCDDVSTRVRGTALAAEKLGGAP